MWCSNGVTAYPVTPENEEWEKFQTHDEMISACNVPDVLLKNLATSELVELMLNYPLLGDIILYDNPKTGFKIMSQTCNILSELLDREDGVTELLDAYSNFEIEDTSIPEYILEDITEGQLTVADCLENNSAKQGIELEGKNLIQDVFFEAALASDDVSEKLSADEKLILMDEIREKTLDKKNSEIYSAYTYAFYEMTEEDNTRGYFGQITQSATTDEVKAVTGDIATTVKTPNGSSVPVIKRTYSASESASAYNYTITNYPNVTIVSDATTNYNCHSYAWYSQNTNTNVYWMNDPGKYISDGSYTKVGTSPTATKQKVSYLLIPAKEPNVHSGIVYSILLMYSKR